MGTRQDGKQSAQEQARAAAGELFSDDKLLGYGADLGVDLTDRQQLLDAAAVGLTVACWRNTIIEEVHAGTRTKNRRPDDDVDTYETVADPAEQRRLASLLRHRDDGIPDDVMMRLNVSTVLDVRDVLDAVLPEDVVTPGYEIDYPRDGAPDHVGALAGLLEDPARELTMGGATTTAKKLLGPAWNAYTKDVTDKVVHHLRFADLLGARPALWHAALSGRSYASRWFPQPAWERAVGRVRDALARGAVDEAVRDPERWRPEAGDDGFWTAFATAPHLLNGRQARWAIGGCRLDEAVDAVTEEDVEALGGQTPPRFNFTMAMY